VCRTGLDKPIRPAGPVACATKVVEFNERIQDFLHGDLPNRQGVVGLSCDPAHLQRLGIGREHNMIGRLAGVVGFFGVLAGAAQAHVVLTSPNGGETLEAGSVFRIEWHVLIGHNTENWDLFYSTESVGGMYVPIALDLEVGDASSGSDHSYDWTVPNIVDDSVWVRVVQDNAGTDYQDSSNAPFAIVPAPAGVVLLAGGGVGIALRRRPDDSMPRR